MRILFATHNQHKLREIQEILSKFPGTILCIILFRKSLIFQIRFCHFIFHKYPGASPDYWQSAKIASP